MDKTKDRMIKIGIAMLTLGLQNTHSGNISVRVGNEMFITKTGAMKGHLEERDIVLPGLIEPKTGLFQASSETGTHRKILEFAGSAIHAHSLSATLLSYILDSLTPVDVLGKSHLGNVPVVEFEYPVGSKEMEEKIPKILKHHPSSPVLSAFRIFARHYNNLLLSAPACCCTATTCLMYTLLHHELK